MADQHAYESEADVLIADVADYLSQERLPRAISVARAALLAADERGFRRGVEAAIKKCEHIVSVIRTDAYPPQDFAAEQSHQSAGARMCGNAILSLLDEEKSRE